MVVLDQQIRPPQRLVIASRQSRLAMWQASHVREILQKKYPQCQVEIVGLTTKGDRILDQSLSKIGGKGLFIKELESALKDGLADLAVHSLKDVPMSLPEGFALASILERDIPFDAFVSSQYSALEDLPNNAVVGTSSLRRAAMIKAQYPHLQVKSLRGNLDTRLAKLDQGEYSAIILAAVGLKRLGLDQRIRQVLSSDVMLPAVGQGALAIEICSSRIDVLNWLADLNHQPTALAVEAERAVSKALGGSCEIPLAAHAYWQDNQLYLKACVSNENGTQKVLSSAHNFVNTLEEAQNLAEIVVADLERQGAREIMHAVIYKKTID